MALRSVVQVTNQPIAKRRVRSVVAMLAGLSAVLASAATVYEYDELGRLARVDFTDGSYITYDYDAAGNRETVVSTIDTTNPTQPGTVSFSGVTATTANASWNASSDNVGIGGYDYRVNGGSWVSLFGTGTSVGLTDLNDASSNSFDVRARDLAGNTSTVRSDSVTTLDGTAPSQPGSVGFSSITTTTATASWGASSDNVAVTGYDYRVNGGSWTSIGTSTLVGLTGLNEAVSNSFDVRARDAAGNLSTVRSGSVTTLDGTAPSQPGTVGFSSIAATTATASWGASSDNVAVTGYDYRVNGGSWVSMGTSTSVGLTGLNEAASNSFQVRARDAAGNLSSVRSGSVTTLDGTAPTQPGSLGYSNVYTTTTLVSWGASTDNVAVTGYDYKVNSGSWIAIGTSTSRSLTGLTANTSYTFYVRAKDAQGNLSSTRSGSFTTNAHPNAVNDSILVPWNTYHTFNPRTNDTDPNSDPLTVTGTGSALTGGATTNGSTITYIPLDCDITGCTPFAGSDSFTYTISDGRNGADTATVSVTVDSLSLFSVNDPSASEGNSITFTVSRSGGTATTQTVNYATANNTAVSGSDYTTTSGTLTFTSGQTSKPVVVPTVEDSISESTETFYLNLSSPSSGSTVTDSQGVGTINDDDVSWIQIASIPAYNNPTVLSGHTSTYTCWFNADWYYNIYETICTVSGSGMRFHRNHVNGAVWVYNSSHRYNSGYYEVLSSAYGQ
jgi:YD repeat-containing protein